MSTRLSRAIRLTVATALTLLVGGLVLTGPAPAQAKGENLTVPATLHIIYIRCNEQDDQWGSDEPYITINGQRVWEAGNVDALDYVNVEINVPFDDQVNVQLWEDDGGLSGGDDLMGNWYMWAGEAGSGQHTVDSQYTSGWYWFHYEVI